MTITIVTHFTRMSGFTSQMMEHTASLDARTIAVIYPNNPDFMELLRTAKEHGWEVAADKDFHVVVNESGGTVMTVEPSDFVSPDWIDAVKATIGGSTRVGLTSFRLMRKLTGEVITVKSAKGVLQSGGAMRAANGDERPSVLPMDTDDMLVRVIEEGPGVSPWWKFAVGAEKAELPRWTPDPYESLAMEKIYPLVSAGIIAKVSVAHDAERLELAVDTAKSVADEVVVLFDNRSLPIQIDVDRTDTHQWDGFANARNKVAELCSNDWVFVIDADELLVNPGDIREKIEKCPDDKIAVGVNVYSVTDNGVEETFTSVRAYRKSRAHWRFSPHNELFANVGGERLKESDVSPSTGVIESHYIGTAQDKARRAIPDMERAMSDDPDEPRWPYFLARSYVALGNFEKAMAAARQCISMAGDDPRYARAYFELARLQLASGQIGDGLATIAKGSERHELYPDIRYLAMLVELQAWTQACASPRYTGQPNVSLRFSHNAAQVGNLLGFNPVK